MLYYVAQLVGEFKLKYVGCRKCLKLYVHNLKYAVNHSPLSMYLRTVSLYRIL